MALYTAHSPIDLLTVTEQLKKQGELDAAGGLFYVAQLTNKIGSAANIEYHARVLLEKFIQRQMISVSTETIKDAYEDTTDVFQLLDRFEKQVFELGAGAYGSTEQDATTLIDKAVTELENSTGEKPVFGTSTGFKTIDAITLGFHPGDLIILAARPSMGKTALALFF
jgi:replicative DNA helicase